MSQRPDFAFYATPGVRIEAVVPVSIHRRSIWPFLMRRRNVGVVAIFSFHALAKSAEVSTVGVSFANLLEQLRARQHRMDRRADQLRA